MFPTHESKNDSWMGHDEYAIPGFDSPADSQVQRRVMECVGRAP
jgi:hypothetical protein